MLGYKLITVELTKYSSWLINSNYGRFNLKYNYITNPEFNAMKNKFGTSHNKENPRKVIYRSQLIEESSNKDWCYKYKDYNWFQSTYLQ